MNLAEISQEAFGFDVAEVPLGLEDGVEAPTPTSPTKSRMFGSAHKRTRSNGVPSGAQTSILYQLSQTMRDLESLILAFDALENFAMIFEKVDKYVFFRVWFVNGFTDKCIGTGVDGTLERRGTSKKNCRSHWMKSECMWTGFSTSG